MKIDPSAIRVSSSLGLGWTTLLVAAVLATGGGCDDGNGPPANGRPDAGTDVANVAASCKWTDDAPALALPQSEVKGVLRGTSRNSSTTCTRQKGTGGPELIYALPIAQRTVVELETISTLDTVIAIRRACDDPLTEVACNDLGTSVGLPDQTTGSFDAGVPTSPPLIGPISPPGPSVDAGTPVPGTQTRDGHLRTTLDPGTYFVVVDEAEPFGVGGPFTLKLRSSPPPAQASCASALPVMNGTSLAAEQLDLSAERDPGCAGASQSSALFYTATIPSGQRLTVRATATGGSVGWTPTIQLIADCKQSLCLASNAAASSSGGRVLRYVNNDAQDLKVTIAVGANTAVSGGTLRLDFSIGEAIVNATCQSARPIVDRQTLFNQDLSEGRPDENSGRCRPTNSPSLFYSVRLLPSQTMMVTATSREPFKSSPLFLSIWETCDSVRFGCGPMAPQTITFTNSGQETKTLVVQVSSFGFTEAPGLFDLTLSLSLPPGGVAVSAQPGLFTSETGTNAQFTVVLKSPPLQPVTVPLVSSDPKEGTVAPASLTFTTANWNVPQFVTVTGVDDSDKDGDRPYTVLVQPSASADKRYSGIDGDDVALVNQDDEPGLRVSAPGTLYTSESGAPATFTVVLNQAPTAPVSVPIKSSDESEGTVAPALLSFTASNWSVPQLVTVTGVDDTQSDTLQTYQITLGPATSTDPNYAGATTPDLPARNLDDEFHAALPQRIAPTLECSFPDNARTISVDQAGIIYIFLGCAGNGVPPAGTFDPATPIFPGGSADGGMGSAGNGATAPTDAAGAAPLPPPSRDAADIPPPIKPEFGQHLYVVVSLDGGKTFGTPVPTGVPGFPIAAVGGVGGTAIVLSNSGDGGLSVMRTRDGGATWAKSESSIADSDWGLLDASGDHIAILSRGNSGPTLWISTDGARTFVKGSTPLSDAIALRIAADGKLWTVTNNDQLRLQSVSGDGVNVGEDFNVPLNQNLEAIALGRKTLFALDGGQLLVAPLKTSPTLVRIPGLDGPTSFPRQLIPTPGDGLLALNFTFERTLEGRWLAPGATTLGPTRILGKLSAAPAAAALSDNAAVLLLPTGNEFWVQVDVAP